MLWIRALYRRVCGSGDLKNIINSPVYFHCLLLSQSEAACIVYVCIWQETALLFSITIALSKRQPSRLSLMFFILSLRFVVIEDRYPGKQKKATVVYH